MKTLLGLIGAIIMFCSCSKELYNSGLPLEDKLYVLESKSRYLHFQTATKDLPKTSTNLINNKPQDGDYIIRRDYRSKFIYSR